MAIEDLIKPFFSNQATGWYSAYVEVMRDFKDPNYASPSSADEIQPKHIKFFARVMFERNSIAAVTEQDLERILLVMRLLYLLENIDPLNRPQSFYQKLKQVIPATKTVNDDFESMQDFINNCLKCNAISNEQLQKAYDTIMTSLKRNSAHRKTAAAVAFIESGKVKDLPSTPWRAFETMTKAMTTMPIKHATDELYKERNVTDPTRALEPNELLKCDIYQEIFSNYLPLLAKENSVLFRQFNQKIREIILRYDFPIAPADRVELNQILKAGAVKLATALSRVKGGKHTVAASEIRQLIDPSYDRESSRLTEILKKPAKLLSDADKQERSKVVKRYIEKIRDLAESFAELLGFKINQIPIIDPLIQGAEPVDSEKLRSQILQTADFLLKDSPDLENERERFARRMRRLRQAVSDWVMATNYAHPDFVLEPHKEGLYFMQQCRKALNKTDEVNPGAYNSTDLQEQRENSFDELKAKVKKQLAITAQELEILKLQNGDAQRQDNLKIIYKRLEELQLKMAENTSLSGTDFVHYQGEWLELFADYSNLQPAIPVQNINAAPKDSMPNPFAQATNTKFPNRGRAMSWPNSFG